MTRPPQTGTTDGRKRAALVLSGGGALGVAHIGVAEELERRGYSFDMVAGVSAGAIVGAMLAAGHSAPAIWEIVRSTKLFSLAADLSPASFGLIRGEKIYKLFLEYFGSRTFSDLAVPLVIGATDFRTGERVMISSGRIADAVRASISVPILFDPFFHPQLERWLVDGGLTQNLPLDTVLQQYQGDEIFSVDVATALDPDVNFADGKRLRMRKRLADAALRTLRIFLKQQQAGLPEDHRVRWVRPELAKYGAADVFKLEKIYEIGRTAAGQL